MKDPARHAAYNALLQVERQGTFSNLAIKETAASLLTRDRRFATELVYSALEHQLALDALIAAYSQTPPRDVEMRVLLRLGLTQLLYLSKVPASAACNETVNMAQELGLGARKGYVNGLMRQVLRERDHLPFPKMEKDYAQYISITSSWPRWIVDRLLVRMSARDVEKLLNYRFYRGAWVRPNRLKVTQAQWRQRIDRFEAKEAVKSRIAPDAWRLVSQGDLTRDSWFVTGKLAVQREGSQLAVHVMEAQPGWRVLDACAAPGGKSAYLAQYMENKGAVTALDIHKHRVELIDKTVSRLGAVIVSPKVQDAAQPRPEWTQRMDAVLIDAPCSGLGVISGKPEIKYQHTPDDIRRLAATQGQILDTCCSYVKPGGRLMYCTCTFMKEENEDVVQAFLRRHPEFELEPFADRVPESLRRRAETGMLQLWPHTDNTDGFFMARMRRSR